MGYAALGVGILMVMLATKRIGAWGHLLGALVGVVFAVVALIRSGHWLAKVAGGVGFALSLISPMLALLWLLAGDPPPRAYAPPSQISPAQAAPLPDSIPKILPGLYYTGNGGIYYGGMEPKDGKLWLKGRFASWAISASGQAVAVVSAKNRISVIGPKGLKSFDTPDTPRVTGWSPDGRYLLYVVAYGQAGVEAKSVHRLDTQTWTVTDLAPKGKPDFTGVRYSPDGRYISYQLLEKRNNRITFWIYVADPDLQNPRLIGPADDYDWSPDNKSILANDVSWLDIYQVSDGKQIAHNPGPGHSGTTLWGPDNRVYVEGRHGGIEAGGIAVIKDGDEPFAWVFGSK